jgi:hypothetical protein
MYSIERLRPLRKVTSRSIETPIASIDMMSRMITTSLATTPIWLQRPSREKSMFVSFMVRVMRRYDGESLHTVVHVVAEVGGLAVDRKGW